MAKKEPTIDDALTMFMDVLNRSQVVSMKYENNILYTKNEKSSSPMVLIVDHTLWVKLMENEKFSSMISELSPLDENDRVTLDRINLVKDMDSGWLEISADSMQNDDRIFINLDGFEYQIEINKTIWPLRFKKAEFTNFSYQIFPKPYNTFVIRKKFDGPVDDSSFYLMRLFQII